MYQQFWGYKVEEKLYLGVREQKRFNTTVLEVSVFAIRPRVCGFKSCRGRRIFRGDKNQQQAFPRSGIKPLIPLHKMYVYLFIHLWLI
jgi:hypothetical protein